MSVKSSFPSVEAGKLGVDGLLTGIHVVIKKFGAFFNLYAIVSIEAASSGGKPVIIMR